MVTGPLREHLEQYLRATLARVSAGQAVAFSALTAGAGCGHDFEHTREWAHRRRLDPAATQDWAETLGAHCDHELLALLTAQTQRSPW